MFSPSSPIRPVLASILSPSCRRVCLLVGLCLCVLRKDRTLSRDACLPAGERHRRSFIVCTLASDCRVYWWGENPTVYCTLFWVAYGASGVLTFLHRAADLPRRAGAAAWPPPPGAGGLPLGRRGLCRALRGAGDRAAVLPRRIRCRSRCCRPCAASACWSSVLLAFILLSAQALGISWRSRIVGITLGFGVLAVVDTVCFLFLLRISLPAPALAAGAGSGQR